MHCAVIDGFPGRPARAPEECYGVQNGGTGGAGGRGSRKPLGMMHRTIEAPHRRRSRDLQSVRGSPWGIRAPRLFPPNRPQNGSFAVPALFKCISGDHEASPPARQGHFRKPALNMQLPVVEAGTWRGLLVQTVKS